jgi:hypothetical protein
VTERPVSRWDHEPPAVGEHRAEALLPPEHRPADSHDEENRGVGRIPEGLGAELDPVTSIIRSATFAPPSAFRHLALEEAGASNPASL